MTRLVTGEPVRRPKRSSHSGDENVPGLAARKAAARLLAAVVDARTPLDGLTDTEHGHPQYRALDPRDRSLVRAILASALRHRMTIANLLARRLERPLPANATVLSHILHVAAAQMLFLDVPDSAAVDLAVTHAKSDPRTQRFSGLVNGVLRSLARVKERALPAEMAKNNDAPDWFADRLTTAYGAGKAQAIMAAHRAEAPVDFTVRSDPERWARAFGGFVLPTGSVRVEKLPASVSELPGFSDGEWWVQDAAAALPARLFGEVSGLAVADLCAAPGGKTAQLAAMGARVTALDASSNRLQRLRSNLERLGLEAQTVESDLFAFRPAEPFDAVLLDAPCSSTGTVRRHPDVPWTKSPADVAKLADLQFRMLGTAIRLVRPGGLVVFSNCSLDPSEGEDLVARFVAEEPDIDLMPIRAGDISGADEFIRQDGTMRTTPADWNRGSPGVSGLDGFFAAKLLRLR